MAKGSKKSGRFTLILIFLFLIVLVASLAYNYYVFTKTKDTRKELNKLTTKLEEIQKEKETNLTDVTKIEEEIAKYDDLDKQIGDARSSYYANIKKLEDEIIAKKTKKKIAYLTFDDGPYANTLKVLDILSKKDVKATFFTQSGNGEKCWDNRSKNCFDMYKEYTKYDHTIANHTYYHAIWNSTYSSANEFVKQIKDQHEHIKKYSGGYIPNIMRFPGGMNTAKARLGSKGYDKVIAEVRKLGYGWVDWTAQDGDGGDLSSTTQAWSNFKSSINSDIEVVLFHDYDSRTTAILPDVIDYLRTNGYELFPLFYESNMINK